LFYKIFECCYYFGIRLLTAVNTALFHGVIANEDADPQETTALKCDLHKYLPTLTILSRF